MKERMMKTESLNFLRAFYLGMAAGSFLNEKIDIEESQLSLFGDTVAIARKIGSDEGNELLTAIAQKTGVVMNGNNEVHEEILSALTRDTILNAVSKLASTVTTHMDASLDTNMMRELHELLGSYLEIS